MRVGHDVKLGHHWDEAVGLFCSCGETMWVFVGHTEKEGWHEFTLAEANAWADDHSIRAENAQ